MKEIATNKELIEKMVQDHIENPWAVFQNITSVDDVEEYITQIDGPERVSEILNRDSIKGFHAEEAACGCI